MQILRNFTNTKLQFSKTHARQRGVHPFSAVCRPGCTRAHSFRYVTMQKVGREGRPRSYLSLSRAVSPIWVTGQRARPELAAQTSQESGSCSRAKWEKRRAERGRVPRKRDAILGRSSFLTVETFATAFSTRAKNTLATRVSRKLTPLFAEGMGQK